MLTIKELNAAFPNNTLTLEDTFELTGVTQDTRKIQPGQLYVALSGTNFDGHNFIDEAFAKGAAAALVEKSAKLKNKNLVFCDDVLASLSQLAKTYRQRFTQPVIAITGSNGKTTTKEFLAHVLASFGEVIATTGNLNNHIGVPLTLLRFTDQAKFFVVEMGMNHLGEIRALTHLTQPDIGLITCVAPAHLEGVGGTLEGVALAKAELFEELTPQALAIVNNDDPLIARMPTQARKTSFGLQQAAAVSASDIKTVGSQTHFTLTYKNESFPITLQLIGNHHIRNALAIFAICAELKLPAPTVIHGLKSFTIGFNRGRLLEKHGTQIIDDTYNANPGSMQVAFEAFAAQFPKKRKIAVLGGMLELGEKTSSWHVKTGKAAKIAGFDALFAYGEGAQDYLVGFGSGESFSDHAQLAQAVRQSLATQIGEAAILVKGSRGMTMEKFIEYF